MMKEIDVRVLMKALLNTPLDSLVFVNSTGNLSVIDVSGHYLGFIDFISGDFRPAD